MVQNNEGAGHLCILSCILLGNRVQEGCKKACKCLSPLIMRKISYMKLSHHVQNSL